jgi:hypothetical protein
MKQEISQVNFPDLLDNRWMSELVSPESKAHGENGDNSAPSKPPKRRRISVTLTSRAADIVARYQAEHKVSKTRAIEELILLNR